MPAKINYAKQLKLWEKRRARCLELRAEGWTLERIAQHLNISRQRVLQILQKEAA